MRAKQYRIFAADFETTVYDGQEYTEVWASGLCEFGTEEVFIFHSIQDTFDFILSMKSNVMLYYHNLKFDGTFWISYLLDVLQYEQAYILRDPDTGLECDWIEDKYMKNKTFKYSISDRGQWYYIIIKAGGHYIEIRDSLKLMPFSLASLGKSFKTKHQKLDMEYKGFRYAGCEITDREREYLENDVLVLKEALEIMYAEGHDKLTIGSCCLSEYKKITGWYKYNDNFPDLVSIPREHANQIEFNNIFDAPNVDRYIRRAYKGGWCYVVPEKANKELHNGFTADVNSLYPSVMISNKFPVGLPEFWKGNYIPAIAQRDNYYYFVRIKCRFYLKEGYLPFIQIKGKWGYKPTKCLTTSDIEYEPGKFSRYYKDLDGTVKDSFVVLTLTQTDYKLFLEHYTVEDFEILDGCYFYARGGIFNEYIEKYRKIKMESTGSKRGISKLLLNNLYGKMAANDDSSFKIAYLDLDKSVQFAPIEAHGKKAGFIACGAAITSYARDFTIRAAQANYHGPDQPGFVYADTDSIHCDMDPDKVRGIEVDPNEFCKWKLEAYWNTGYFVRAKTYIEIVTHEDGKPVKPWYNIKCAGMPDKCKQLFLHSIKQDLFDWISIREWKALRKYRESLDPEELEYVQEKRTLQDFTIGMRVKGKLMPKRIRGGTILVDTYYEMRNI